MRNIIRFLIQHHFAVLFVLLQLIAFIFIISFNPYQRASFINSSNAVNSFFYKRSSNIIEYFSLRKTNRVLAEENAFLKSRMPESFQLSPNYKRIVEDSLKYKQYIYRSGKVINNTITGKFNYLTIDKGNKDSIKKEMGVISSEGVVGIINNTSSHFSTAISVLNTRLKISAKLEGSNFFGSIEWDGKSYQYVQLNEIPLHAVVRPGDIVVTSGFSAIFPEGIPIGVVEKVTLDEGDSFFRILVKLSVDFKSITFVEMVENQDRDEKIQLESNSYND
ncbi:MAG: rod shape-determining protein MreC [Marinilabiliaceae bacterium]|nr:rod shape-determining protein MreC [Marinilabiliaceae bacterium]